jgi:hypothetical protein
MKIYILEKRCHHQSEVWSTIDAFGSLKEAQKAFNKAVKNIRKNYKSENKHLVPEDNKNPDPSDYFYTKTSNFFCCYKSTDGFSDDFEDTISIIERDIKIPKKDIE